MPEPLAANFNVGDVFEGRYELRRDLGQGGAGHVFEAIHRFTGRHVALKLIAPDAPRAMRSELYARLGREARALAAVRHPGIVDVLDGGVLEDGRPFLVMELLEGRTLEGLLASRGRLSVDDTVALGGQLSLALAAVHAAGILHRDVKPSNMLVVRDPLGSEMVKLLDFGIARTETAKEDKLTGLGAVIGTPDYMSPEQLLALDDPDVRSDVYSVGVTLYECLTGLVPYKGTYAQVLLQVCSTNPAPVIAPETGVPPALAAVVARAMAKSRDDRFSSMKELLLALEAAVPVSEPRRRTQFFGPPPVPAAKPEAGGRRKLVRASYVTPVRLVMGDVTIDGRTEDISTGGVLIVCRQLCPAERGTLRLALPMDGKVVSLAVQVRWVRAARADDPSGPRALGVEFVEPPPEMTAAIARYVSLMTDPDAQK